MKDEVIAGLQNQLNERASKPEIVPLKDNDKTKYWLRYDFQLYYRQREV